MISHRKSAQVSKVSRKEMNLPKPVLEKAVANPQLKATVSPAEKLKRLPDLSPRKKGSIPPLAESPRAVSLPENQLRASVALESERITEKKVCIACGSSNSDECNCFRKPEKKREIDGKLEELFAAQKKKMSVSEYREYEHQRKCYIQKHNIPYLEMIMGHGDDNSAWPKQCDIYHENSVRIQDALAALGKEISLYSIVPNSADNDKIRAMFNNHQTIADGLAGSSREKGPGYDHYSWSQVCNIYNENSKRIERYLSETKGIESSLSETIGIVEISLPLVPKSENNDADAISVMLCNHQRIADALAGNSRFEGPYYDDCSWQQVCDIYHENSMQIQDTFEIMGKEISLYSILPDSKDNDKIRAMFNNHQTIANALAGSCRDKGPGYDHYSWEQVCDIYHENMERIQDSLETLGVKISLASMYPKVEDKDKIRTMFNNHRTLAQVLGRSKRNKRFAGALIVAVFGGVFFPQTIAGYFIGKGFDFIWDSIQNANTKEPKPTLSDYTRILAQPEFFGSLQQWLYDTKNSSADTPIDVIPLPTKRAMNFDDGRQVIKIPNFEVKEAATGCFDYFVKKLAKPYYKKLEIEEGEINTERITQFAAMLFHNGKIIFQNAEENMDNSDHDYAKLITEKYLNKNWVEDE